MPPENETPDQRDKRRRKARERAAKKRAEKRAAEQAPVIDLFGHAGARNDPDDVLPHGVNGPRPEHRKTRPRDKVRLSANMTEMTRAIAAGETTMAEVVAAMDPEELARGMFKTSRGDFATRPPKIMPTDFHTACIRELLRRGQDIYRSNFLTAINVFTQVANDPSVDASQRLKAAQYIWERVEGKVPDRVEVAQAEPWQTIIDGIVAEAEDDQIARASRVLNGGE